MTLERPAPMLKRTAISRRRAADRARRRLAMLAQAIARMRPTSVNRMYRGFEYLRRSASNPPWPSFTIRLGRSQRVRAVLTVRIHSENRGPMTACACAAVTPGRRRAMISIHSKFGLRYLAAGCEPGLAASSTRLAWNGI